MVHKIDPYGGSCCQISMKMGISITRYWFGTRFKEKRCFLQLSDKNSNENKKHPQEKQKWMPQKSSWLMEKWTTIKGNMIMSSNTDGSKTDIPWINRTLFLEALLCKDVNFHKNSKRTKRYEQKICDVKESIRVFVDERKKFV